MHGKRGLCRHAVSQCLCVRHVRTLCQNELTYLFSHTILVFPYQNGMAIFRWDPPLMGASNAGGVGRNPDSEPGFTACC